MSCEAFIPLLALRPQDLEPVEDATLQAHLAACPSCRDRKARVQALDRTVRAETRGMGRPFARRGRWVWAAAAAALAAVVWQGMRGTTPGSEDASPGSAEALNGPVPEAWIQARGPVEASRGRELVLGSSALLSLRAGSRVFLDPAGLSLRLEGGALHLDTRGDRLKVHAGEVVLEAEDAAFSAEVMAEGQTPSFGWLAAAHADEAPALSLVVRRGRVSLKAGDLLLELKEGEGGVWRQGRLVREVRACWEPTGWRKLEAPGALRDGILELPIPSGSYLVEMLVCRRDARAELGLRLAVDGRVFEIPVGGAWKGTGWVRLRLAAGGGRARASAGSVPLVDGSLDGTLGRWPEAGGKWPGIRVWGGDLEIRDVRWRLQ